MYLNIELNLQRIQVDRLYMLCKYLDFKIYFKNIINNLNIISIFLKINTITFKYVHIYIYIYTVNRVQNAK